MSKANYTYEVTPFAGRDCIFIKDLNQGGMSVTNDIENVVEDIGEKDNIDPSLYMIVYQDSEGRWDGWDHHLCKFVILGCDNQYHAIRRYAKMLAGDVTIFSNNKKKEDNMKSQPDELKRSFDPGPGDEEEEEGTVDAPGTEETGE